MPGHGFQELSVVFWLEGVHATESATGIPFRQLGLHVLVVQCCSPLRESASPVIPDEQQRQQEGIGRQCLQVWSALQLHMEFGNVASPGGIGMAGEPAFHTRVALCWAY